MRGISMPKVPLKDLRKQHLHNPNHTAPTHIPLLPIRPIRHPNNLLKLLIELLSRLIVVLVAEEAGHGVVFWRELDELAGYEGHVD